MNIKVMVCYMALGLVGLAIIISFVRMYMGPTLSDRIVALDLAANIIVSFIAIYSVLVGQSIYVDVVIALALIIFLTTVAFANLIFKQSEMMESSKKDILA